MKNKTPKELIERVVILSNDLDKSSVIDAMKEFGKQYFISARQEEHSKELDWFTYRNFEEYMKDIEK